jgi:hypothetical protein
MTRYFFHPELSFCFGVATDKGIRPQSVFCMCARRVGWCPTHTHFLSSRKISSGCTNLQMRSGDYFLLRKFYSAIVRDTSISIVTRSEWVGPKMCVRGSVLVSNEMEFTFRWAPCPQLVSWKKKCVPEVFGHRKLNHFLLSRVKNIYLLCWLCSHIFSGWLQRKYSLSAGKKYSLKFDVMLCSNASWPI